MGISLTPPSGPGIPTNPIGGAPPSPDLSKSGLIGQGANAQNAQNTDNAPDAGSDNTGGAEPTTTDNLTIQQQQGEGGGNSGGGAGNDDDETKGTSGTEEASVIASQSKDSSSGITPNTQTTSNYGLQTSQSSAGASMAFTISSIKANMEAQNDITEMKESATQMENAAASAAYTNTINEGEENAQQTTLQGQESLASGVSSFASVGGSLAYSKMADTNDAECKQTAFQDDSTKTTLKQTMTNPTAQPSVSNKAKTYEATNPGKPVPEDQTEYSNQQISFGGPNNPPILNSDGTARQSQTPTDADRNNGYVTVGTGNRGADDKYPTNTKIPLPDISPPKTQKTTSGVTGGASTTPGDTAGQKSADQITDDQVSLLNTGRLPDPKDGKYPSQGEIETRTRAAFKDLSPEQQRTVIDKANANKHSVAENKRVADQTRINKQEAINQKITLMNTVGQATASVATFALKLQEATATYQAAQDRANAQIEQANLNIANTILSQAVQMSQELAQSSQAALQTQAQVSQSTQN